MHPEAYSGFADKVLEAGLDPTAELKVLDIGSHNANGNVRDLLPNSAWTGLDIVDGEDVDIVADATTWRSKRRFDVVATTETFEHLEDWRALLDTAVHHLSKNGPQVLLVTCASTGRPVHGAWGAPHLQAGEWYNNVSPEDLRTELEARFEDVSVTYRQNPGDAYAYAKGVKK